MNKINLSFCVFLLLAFSLHAQKVVDEKLLIGNWKFIKTVDKKGKELNNIQFGDDLQLNTDGPDMKINQDRTYIFKSNAFFGNYTFWDLKNSILSFKHKILKNSDFGKTIDEFKNHRHFKKYETDSIGNFLYETKFDIISIEPNQMKIRLEKKYYMIYEKSSSFDSIVK